MKKENTKRIDLDSSVLIIIDIQEKLFPEMENKEEILKNSYILLDGAKNIGLETLIWEQYPKGLGHTISELQEVIKDFTVYEKNSFSVYTDNKDKIEMLAKKGKDTFILAGIESHICLYQSAKDLLEAGYRVCMVEDAIGSRKIKNHNTAIATLRDMGAIILPTESILFELMAKSKHPSFKSISKLVK